MSEYVSPIEMPSFAVTRYYIASFLKSGAVLLVLSYFWGDHILLSFSDLTKGGTDVSSSGLGKVWFIFAWAAIATIAIYALAGRPDSFQSKGVQLVKGWWLSANAGIFEELIYRWMVFFAAMITLPFLNVITFGFTKWIYVKGLVPLANWSTFHALEPYLLQPGSWVIGAALVSASIEFRNLHEHLGLIGWVNSWFGGMVMFYLVLNYGLMTAIVAHAIYDAIVFSIRALASQEPVSLFGFTRR